MTLQKALVILIGMTLMVTAGSPLSAAVPPNGGTIYVDAAISPEADPDTVAALKNAADRALGTKGFTILDDAQHASYVADVVMSRTTVGSGQERVSAGKPSIMGTGVNVPFSTGQTRLVPLQRMEVEIRIRKRGERTVIWYGGAVTVRTDGSRGTTPGAMASVLSEAALSIYPGQSPDLAGVP